MKRIILYAASLLIAGTFLLSSCKKKEDITPDNTSTDVTASDATVSSTSTNDNNNVDGDIDDVMSDISTQIDGSARIDAESACGIQSATITGENKKVKITYDGTYCLAARASRSGTVIVTLTKGNDFSEKDAQYTVEYQGYVVTQGGKTLTLTGTHTVINVSGGLPRYVITKPLLYTSVELLVTGTMKLTFDTTSISRDWFVSRKITYGNSNDILSLTISGTGIAGGYTDLVTWGTNRFGDQFYNRITTPIVSNSTCGFRYPIAGERVHILLLADGAITNTVAVTVGSDGCGNGVKVKIKNKNGKEKDITITFNQ
jgi:hypothetical protein